VLHVKFTSVLAQLTGERKVRLDTGGITLRELIDHLSERYGAPFAQGVIGNEGLNEFVNVLVNGESVRHLAGLNTKLEDGDEITFLPTVSGG